MTEATTMDVRDAVKAAKAYVSRVFADERVANLGLEEVERDDDQGVWRITVGFTRPWDTPLLHALTQFRGDVAPALVRTYKIVSVTDSGEVLSVSNRNL